MTDETPVYLLGKRVIFIFGAKASLDVSDFYFAVKSGQRGGHGGGRVALDNDPIGSLRLEHFIEPHQEASRQPGQRLVFLHDVEVIVRLEVEDLEKRFDHFAVLTGKADDRLEGDSVGVINFTSVRTSWLPQGLDDRCQLDDLRPRPKNDQHLDSLFCFFSHGFIFLLICLTSPSASLTSLTLFAI